MTTLQRRVYAAIVRLHPPAFRREFGHEMLLDFEESHDDIGVAFLCADAVQSAARQWTRTLLALIPAVLSAPKPAPQPSLLAGRYAVATLGGPRPTHLLLATLISASFYFALALTLTAHRIPANSAEPSSLATASGRASSFESAVHNGRHTAAQAFAATAPTDFIPDDSPATPQAHIARALSPFTVPSHTPARPRNATVPATGIPRASATRAPATQPEPSLVLTFAPWILLPNLAWLFASLWARHATLARRLALALLAALALVTPAAAQSHLRANTHTLPTKHTTQCSQRVAGNW